MQQANQFTPIIGESQRRIRWLPINRTMLILTGTFVGFWPSGKGKLKFIRIQDGAQEHRVKLPKYMRAGLMRELVTGMGVKVAVRWHDHEWQATDILLFPVVANPLPAPTQSMRTTQPACRVEVCQKGNCRKQGSMQLWQALGDIIRAQGWQEWVFLEASGCQKACQHGPNVRINGQTYHHMQVQHLIPELAARVQQATRQNLG